MIKNKINNKQLISVIVPAYRAEKFIEKNLIKIKKVLDQLGNPYEIICIIDGDIDKTYKKAKGVAEKFPKRIRVFRYKKNIGKGYAIRFGVARSTGELIIFIDADLEADPQGIPMLLEHFKWYQADIIVGSKRHPASKVSYPWQRRLMSFLYQFLVQLLFGLKIKDTQVGMKLFKKDVMKKLLPRLSVNEFAFDIEVLSVANYLGFKKIYEAPVDISKKFEGGLSTITSKGFIIAVTKVVWDTLAVFYKLKIRRYYDDKNKRNWETPKYLKLKTL